MIEPNSTFYLQQNIFELNKILSIISNIDPAVIEAIVTTIQNIERTRLIIEEGSNDYSSGSLLKFLRAKTNILIERLKSAKDLNANNNSDVIDSYNSIFTVVNEINSALHKFDNNNQKNEYTIGNIENDVRLQNALILSKEFEENYADLEDKINYLNKFATDVDTNFESKIKEMKEKLEDVGSSIVKESLSSSFQNRAKKLQTESNRWLFASFISIVSLIGLAAWKLYRFPPISDLNFDTLDLHIRASIIYLPVCIALFWAIWYCTKRYTHLCHLRDEYNYKHDLSQSFIGYKNEVTYLDNLSDSDQKLLPILLSGVIQNICKSPLETNKDECHSPWSEIVSLVCKKGKDKIDKV